MLDKSDNGTVHLLGPLQLSPKMVPVHSSHCLGLSFFELSSQITSKFLISYTDMICVLQVLTENMYNPKFRTAYFNHYLYINTLRKNLFSPLRSQIIVVFYDRLHVHCTSSPSSISSISQHFSSPTDESGDFLFENGNRRRSKCIGDQSARSSSTRGWELGTVRGRSIDSVTVRASGRVARWFFNSWIFHVTRLVSNNMKWSNQSKGTVFRSSLVCL